MALEEKEAREVLGLKVDDRVFVEVGQFTGVGVIVQISTTWDPGHGSDLFPAFLVDFPSGQYGWFNGASLKKMKKKAMDEEKSDHGS